jgi:KaiC/GvpD/RAD55 family RecA-like ATPase
MSGFQVPVPGLEGQVFPPGTTVLVTGRPGVGKSVFAQQMTQEALKVGHNAIVMLTDTPADAFRAQAETAGAPERLQVLDFLIQKPRAINEVSITIHQEIGKLGEGPARLVFDSLSTLGTIFEPGLLPPWVLDQRSRFLKHGSNVLAVMVYDTGIHPPSVTRNLQALSDVVLEMKIDEPAGEPRRLFRVFSARGAAHSVRWYPFTIDDKGLHFESSS